MAEKAAEKNEITDFEWAKTQLQAGKKVALPWYAKGVFYEGLTDETVFGEAEQASTEWFIVE